MKVDVKVRGIEELKRELARMSDAVAKRLGKNARMAAARVAARHARANAPVETGDLRRSIKARRSPDRQRGRVEALAG
jgi:Bacteriophage HK97-gp10, putative tail-component